MQIIFYRIFFIITILLVFSCNYDPGGEYDAEIEQLDPPEATITINENDSVLEIGWRTYCYVQFSSVRAVDIYEISVFIDGTEVTFTEEGYIIIDPRDYTFGEHNLRIEVITSSNTGSLADRLETEGYIYSHDLKLFVQNSSPYENQLPDILSLEKVNGTFKVTWFQYPVINFEKYVLYRLKETLWDGSENYEIAAEIFDRTKNFFYDSSYIGGRTKYYVIVYASGSSATGAPGEINIPLPKIIEATPQGKDLIVTFTKCQFPENFKQYQLYWLNSSWITDACKITDLNDTTLTISGISFGAPVKIELATHFKNSDFSQDRWYEPHTNKTAHLGDTSFAYTDIASVYPCADIYFISDRAYHYSPQENQILHSIPIAKCNLFECHKMGISNDGSKLVISDTDSELLHYYTLPQFEHVNTLTEYSGSYDITISSNEMIPVPSNGIFRIFDFNTNTFIDTLFSSPYGGFYGAQSYISHNGQTVYVDSDIIDTVFNYSNGDYNSKAVNYDKFTTFVEYNPFNQDEFIIHSLGRLYVVNNSTLSISKSFNLANPPRSNIDPVTGLFLVDEDPDFLIDKWVIYDFTTGLKVKELNINRDFTMRIFNGVLYSSYGHKINLNNL